MKRSLIFLVVLQFLFVNCSDDDVTAKNSGYFTLSRLNVPTAGRVGSVLETESDFNLGALKASREFLFILGNGGENTITDITLTTNDPAFVVSPQHIAELNGINSTSSEIIPIISLGIIHGKQLNGIGYTDLLEQGEHTVLVNITGTTLVNGARTEVESEFEFILNAKVLALKLTYGETEVDFSEPGSVSSGFFPGGLSTMLGYGVPSDRVMFHNTGNVEMKVVSVSTQDDTDVDELIIPAGESEELILVGESEPQIGRQISVDGQGTISDYTKYLIGNDGKIYFELGGSPPEGRIR